MTKLVEASLSSVTHKRIWGRHIEAAKTTALLWTGSGVELMARSSELWFEIEVDFDVYEPWFAIVINGEVSSRMMLPKGRHWFCAFRNLNINTAKHIQLVKEVQAMSADNKHVLIIHSIKYDGELQAVPTYSKKIEFIGDSITSGEGAIGAKQEEDWSSIWFSAVQNYTRYTACKLNAEYRVISQSGWGVYSSWDGHTEYNIPSYYEQVCGLMHGENHMQLGLKQNYNFASWQPDYIVINLGTNDATAYRALLLHERDNSGSGSEACKQYLENYRNAIIHFLTKVRKNNRNSQIIWAYGMLGYELIDHIESAIALYKQTHSDAEVYLCKLPSMDDHTVGSRFHPGQKSHINAADELYEFIMKLIEKEPLKTK